MGPGGAVSEQQLSFHGLSTNWLPVVDDYGPIGKGASAAHSVLAENGSEYLIKGPSLTPGDPSLRYAAANELVAALLARHLGLPVLDFCILEMRGELFFGSSWMQTGTFYPAIDESLYDKCENKDRVYELVAFDVWVCNIDRHQENLLVRHARSTGASGEHFLLLLNDHGHCVIPPPNTPATLSGLVRSPADGYVRLDFVRRAIEEPTKLTAAIDRVEGLGPNIIEAVVRSVPEPLLPAAERQPVERFLLDRRAQLRTVFEGGRTYFVNLGRGTL